MFFGKKILAILRDESSNLPKQFEQTVYEIGEFHLDEEVLDRENLLIAIKITKLKNMLYEEINNHFLSIQAESDDLDRNDRELSELADEIRKLNSFIQAEKSFVETMDRVPSFMKKTAEAVQINLFFVSIPVQSVIDLIETAKKQMDKSSNQNIRFVSSLLTNASFIINDFIKKSRDFLRSMPNRVQEFAESVRTRTTLTASHVANYVYTRKIRKIKPRFSDYSDESSSYQLSTVRDVLIDYLVDFKRWSPERTDDIFTSALFKLIFYGDIYYPHSRPSVEKISRDMSNLRNQPTEVVHTYMITRVEEIVDAISAEIRRLEGRKMT